eukprot:UN00961
MMMHKVVVVVVVVRHALQNLLNVQIKVLQQIVMIQNVFVILNLVLLVIHVQHVTTSMSSTKVYLIHKIV